MDRPRTLSRRRTSPAKTDMTLELWLLGLGKREKEVKKQQASAASQKSKAQIGKQLLFEEGVG